MAQTHAHPMTVAHRRRHSEPLYTMLRHWAACFGPFGDSAPAAHPDATPCEACRENTAGTRYSLQRRATLPKWWIRRWMTQRTSTGLRAKLTAGSNEPPRSS